MNVLNLIKCVWILLICCLSCPQTFAQQERHPQPQANFTVSDFCYRDTAYFTNTTTRASAYQWSIFYQNDTIFQDTTTNIKFLFPHKGTYTVELMAYNGHVVYTDREIVVDSITTAHFAYQDCFSQYINMSVCYTSCKWLFGDGNSSTENCPIHYYDSTGRYKVTLIAYGSSRTDTISDSVNVYIINDLNGNFFYRVYKDSVLFVPNDSVSGPFTQFNWTFGDGTTASQFALTGRKIWHKYAIKDSTYTVFFQAKGLCVFSYSNKNIFVPDSTPASDTYVYPNPLSGLTLRLATNLKTNITSISLTNCLGQEIQGLVLSESVKGYNIDVGSLPTGVYILNMYFAGGARRFKILKL
jgi:PKD repeat protein